MTSTVSGTINQTLSSWRYYCVSVPNWFRIGPISQQPPIEINKNSKTRLIFDEKHFVQHNGSLGFASLMHGHIISISFDFHAVITLRQVSASSDASCMFRLPTPSSPTPSTTTTSTTTNASSINALCPRRDRDAKCPTDSERSPPSEEGHVKVWSLPWEPEQNSERGERVRSFNWFIKHSVATSLFEWHLTPPFLWLILRTRGA